MNLTLDQIKRSAAIDSEIIIQFDGIGSAHLVVMFSTFAVDAINYDKAADEDSKARVGKSLLKFKEVYQAHAFHLTC